MALFGIRSQQDQVMFGIIAACIAAAYAFYEYKHQPDQERISAAEAEIRTIDSVVAQAKAELAAGTVEALRRKVEEYRGTLSQMRRLVPEQNEVPTLIDDISNRAKVRGVHMDRIQPLAVEPGSPFHTHRYRLSVFGRYDQVGEFLTDVASLSRIIVPEDVKLRRAAAAAEKLLGDTLGSLLETEFAIRTFVKAPAPARSAGGTAPARP